MTALVSFSLTDLLDKVSADPDLHKAVSSARTPLCRGCAGLIPEALVAGCPRTGAAISARKPCRFEGRECINR